MAIWYVDPEGGNDANAGTSFALRTRTFHPFTPAAGDTVRIIASVPPWTLGSATWTDNSGTVTLASAATLTIDNCETAWTAAANVTASAAASYRKQGSNSATFALASGLANSALIGYKALGATTDFSAYSCVSLWCMTSTAFQTSGSFTVALCSDSAGATPLVTLTLSARCLAALSGFSPNLPFPLLFENSGAALPAGVNSIALYAGSTKPFASGTVYIDNVIATTAANAASHLSHGCVIGKNTVGEPEWYPIMSIDGTTVVLGQLQDYSASVPARKYRGTTGAATTYAMLGLRTYMTSSGSTSQAVINGTGTAIAPIVWSGGWDSTAMSTQSGQTWLNGMFVQAYLWSNYPGNSWHTLPDTSLGFMGATSSPFLQNGQSGRVLKVLGITNCAAPLGGSTSILYELDYEADNIVACTGGFTYVTFPSGGLAKIKFRIRRITCSPGTAFSFGANYDDNCSDFAIQSIDNNNLGIILSTPARVRVRNTTFANNGNDIQMYGGTAGAELLLDRPVFTSGAPVFSSNSNATMSVYMTAVGGNRWDNRVYRADTAQTTDQTTVHGTTAQSIKINIVDYQQIVGVPYRTRLARIACLSGKTITFTAWMQRSDATNVTAGIMVLSGSVAGVSDTSYAASGAVSTWEQGTISFTPTEDGVVDVWAYVGSVNSSANTKNVWFGDTAVSST